MKYMTGVTSRDRKVDEINPPIMTQANGDEVDIFWSSSEKP